MPEATTKSGISSDVERSVGTVAGGCYWFWALEICIYVLTQSHWGQEHETYVAIVCRMESWHHVYVCMYVSALVQALVRTHVQDVHWRGDWPWAEGTLWVGLYISSICKGWVVWAGSWSVPAHSKKLNWPAGKPNWFLVQALQSVSRSAMSLILTGPQECLGDYPSGRLGKLEPSFRLFASVGRQDSQREGLWFWQLWASLDKGVGIDLGKFWADQPSDSLRSMGSVEVEMAWR